MATYREIASELLRLKRLSDTTEDGQPEGLGETESALYEYFNYHFDEIITALNS